MKPVTILLITITATCLFIGRVESNATCSLSKYCTAAGWCENFTSLAELNSTLPPLSSATACQDLFNTSILNYRPGSFIIDSASVNFKANAYKGIINDQFSITHFLTSIFPTQGVHNVLLNFCGFSGLDLNLTLVSQQAPSFAISNWTQASYEMDIGYIASSVDLYMNGTPIVMSSDGGRTCDETHLAAIIKTTKMNLSVFRWVSWAGGQLVLKNVKQQRGPLCALAFKNVKLQVLIFKGSLVKFFPTTSNTDMSGTNILNLDMYDLAIEKLDATVLHPQVFSSVTSLTLYRCSLRHIQLDLFKNMQSLRSITLSINNLKGFVHGNGIEWMSYLAPNSPDLTPGSLKSSVCDIACQNLLDNVISVDFEETIFGGGFNPIGIFPNLFYTYPEADFCTFANFSFNKLIVVTLKNNNQEFVLNHTSSCTMIWLSKNLALVLNFSDHKWIQPILLNVQPILWNIIDFAHAYNECDFPTRRQNCAPVLDDLKETESNYIDPYFQLYDIQYFLSQASSFLSSGFNIGVSVFALVTNLAICIVIINARRHYKAQGPVFKKDNELNSIGEAFFTYMVANAVINSIFALTILLSTCISCAPKPVDEMLVNQTACLISNMCVAGVVSLMKLMSNYTYLQMSMNRYLLVGKDHAKWIETVAQTKFKTKMCIAFVISCVLSLVSVYQVFYFDGFGLGENNGNEFNSYYYLHSYVYGFAIDSGSFDLASAILQDSFSSDSSMINIVLSLTVVHDLFSYFLFCIFNLALDVMTVIKLKESLADKARLSSTNKRDEQMRAERRSVVMVVLNSIVNILLRLPELLAIVFFFAVAVNPNQEYPFKILCFNFDQCLTLGQISNSFVILSLSFNVFFYYFFNKTFKFAFRLLFCGQKK
jgi:hypothetical protein